jgi:TatD DNase family protein
MESFIFDTHCHPHFPQYDQDRDEILYKAFSEKVRMIAVGTSIEDSIDAINLSKKYPGKIWASVGVHPTEWKNIIEEKDLNDLAKNREVVAIGECGLDYWHILKEEPNRVEAIKNIQKENFKIQINLARRIGKPLIVHSRKAYSETLEILREFAKDIPFVIHFFQGTPQEAEEFIKLGAYVSFAGPITYTKEDEAFGPYDDLVYNVPIERILIETDSPYAAPSPFRGKRNEPAFVKYVAQRIAKIKNIPLEKVIHITTQNAYNLFNIS